MTSMKRRASVSVGAVVLGVTAMFASTSAVLGHEIERQGDCTNGNTDWRLEVEHEDGGFQVDLRIRPRVAGQVWHVVIRQDGNVFFEDDRVTGENGEFRIRRQRPNTAVEDAFRFRATRADEVCRGTVTHA